MLTKKTSYKKSLKNAHQSIQGDATTSTIIANNIKSDDPKKSSKLNHHHKKDKKKAKDGDDKKSGKTKKSDGDGEADLMDPSSPVIKIKSDKPKKLKKEKKMAKDKKVRTNSAKAGYEEALGISTPSKEVY